MIPAQELTDLPGLCRAAFSGDPDIPEPLKDRMYYRLERIHRRRLAAAAISRARTVCRTETLRSIMPSATMICSFVSFARLRVEVRSGDSH
jgi:hypothetical protein